MFEYEQKWFDKMIENQFDTIYKELWQKEFRMSPGTFNFIVAQVRQEMARKNTKFRRAVKIERRVAIALWRLATGSSYRNISKVFGVGRSTASEITNKFCSLLKQKAAQFIQFPRTAVDTAKEVQKFTASTDCAIPQVVGAIDGTHVEILSPGGDSKVDYYCRKQMYSINTQAVVGGNSMFIDVATGYPGSIHDARVLRDSSLYALSEQKRLLVNPVKVVEGFRVRPLLIGDGAYPPLTWLVKPFPYHLNLAQRQKKFNKNLSSARVSVEQAFGLLKARWRCLLKRLDNEMENVPNVIIACCVLHNICQMRCEAYIDDDDVLSSLLREERQGRRLRAQCNQVCRDGDTLRYILTDYTDNNMYVIYNKILPKFLHDSSQHFTFSHCCFH